VAVPPRSEQPSIGPQQQSPENIKRGIARAEAESRASELAWAFSPGAVELGNEEAARIRAEYYTQRHRLGGVPYAGGGYKMPRQDLQPMLRAYGIIPLAGALPLAMDAGISGWHGEWDYAIVSGVGAAAHVAPLCLSRGNAATSGTGPAHNAANGAKLTKHLRQLEKYGAAGFKTLQNGRIRYYGNIKPPRTPGTMAGTRLVREWNPATGRTRTWMETVDHAERVRIVRPETGGPKIHYLFDECGNFVGTF
jgi:hypothetical protein